MKRAIDIDLYQPFCVVLSLLITFWDSPNMHHPCLNYTTLHKVSRIRISILTADEAGLVETPAVTLDLLGVVHRLLTGCTLGASSPVWHLSDFLLYLSALKPNMKLKII